MALKTFADVMEYLPCDQLWAWLNAPVPISDQVFFDCVCDWMRPRRTTADQILEVAAAAGACATKSEARRLIAQRGLRWNGELVVDPYLRVSWLGGSIGVVQIGKTNFHTILRVPPGIAMMSIDQFRAKLLEGAPLKQLSRLIGQLPAADRGEAGRLFAAARKAHEPEKPAETKPGPPSRRFIASWQSGPTGYGMVLSDGELVIRTERGRILVRGENLKVKWT
jgi:hypothetical protein